MEYYLDDVPAAWMTIATHFKHDEGLTQNYKQQSGKQEIVR